MKNIPESELILNTDGSIYHLNLLPEDIAETIITVGDPDRVSEVSKYFDQIELKKGKREFITHTGRVGSKRITVLSTGIGTDNIDIVLTELDALVNIDLKTRTEKATKTSLQIIRIGTSGSLQGDVDVDSFVASEAAIGLDNLMLYYKSDSGAAELLQHFESHCGLTKNNIKPYYAESGKEVMKSFSKNCIQGITVTCPGFYGPQGRIIRNKTAISDLPELLNSFKFNNQRITNFEMETSGIYGLSNLMGHQALSLNAIVANRVKKVFSTRSHQTVDALIKQTLEIFSAQ